MLLMLAGPTITVVAVGVTFFLTDRSHWRKFLLIAGIIGAVLSGLQAYRSRELATQQVEYWDDARLSGSGFEYVGSRDTGILVNSAIMTMIAPYVHDIDINSANFGGRWDCTPAALDAYNAAISHDRKYPFTYFYRATCRKAAGADDWSHDIQTARCLLLITTRLPGHNPNHDGLLERINEGNLSTGN
jgi:hypothetical protein